MTTRKSVDSQQLADGRAFESKECDKNGKPFLAFCAFGGVWGFRILGFGLTLNPKPDTLNPAVQSLIQERALPAR